MAKGHVQHKATERSACWEVAGLGRMPNPK